MAGVPCLGLCMIIPCFDKKWYEVAPAPVCLFAFHFPKGQVQGYESITSTLWLPDPNDRHVLAVAIHTKAKYIVTFDLNHFPNAVLQPHNIEAVSPDELVMRLIQKRPVHILDVVKTHRLSLTRPPKTVDEYLATLEEQGLAKTVAFLREYRSDI